MRFSPHNPQQNIPQKSTPLSHSPLKLPAKQTLTKPTFSMQKMPAKDQNDPYIESVRLNISGMRCASCSASIEGALKSMQGIKEANIYILNHSGVVHFDTRECSIDSILQKIESLGFQATRETKPSFFTQNTAQAQTQTESTKEIPNTAKKQKQNAIMRAHNYIERTLLNDARRLILSLILSVIIIYISMLHEMLSLPLPVLLANPLYNGITQLFITLCVMHFGRSFYIQGIKALIHLRPNMDSLVALGSLAGFFYSLFMLFSSIQNHLYFESVCVILSFIMLGKFIETKAKEKAMRHAKDLLARKQESAQKILNAHAFFTQKDMALETQEVPIAHLQKGDYVRILPHSFIPTDSILHSSHALIDESMLSGESKPVEKLQDSMLLGGTLNLDTPIIARITHTLQDSTITKMQALLTQTIESKAKSAQLADKIAAFFVPLVLFLATCSGVFWFFYANLETALLHFASTLLISCPCALGLATPMAILFANARANKLGIFFKHAQSLESLSSMQTILFDKTGTLTNKDFQIRDIVLADIPTKDSKLTQDSLLHIAASIEIASSHVIAKAICKAFKDKPLYKHIASTHLHAGIEAKLLIDSKERIFLLGNARLLQERANITIKDANNIHGLCVHIAEITENCTHFLGSIYLEETLKPKAKEMMQILKNEGFSCEILSGDNAANVARIAEILGIPYHANCLPQDKMRYIESLQNKGQKVMMVGDGMNDSIALARADLSLVMASGSEVSREQGNILYFRDDLLGIIESLHIGRATLQNIKQNLAFAFLYNSLCIPIAMGCFVSFGIMLNPMLASLAMSLSSLCVVGNASRLYKHKKANEMMI